MQLIDSAIPINDLKPLAAKMFGNLVKAVVDIEMKIMVIDAEMLSDQEMFLLDNGSTQENLWGINLYPDYSKDAPEFIEFDSMINIRPWQGNKSRGVESVKIQKEITQIVRNLIQ
ncbi:MAG TPA: DUF5674 family protein [Chitinispirillaceae bacterium]|nr:DUF5674 family protein [Chitinispirillaceae bacterium]